MFLSSTRILKSGPSVQYRIFRPLSRVTLKIYLTVCFDANSSVDHATDDKQTIDLSMIRLASFVIRANKPFKF